MGSGKTRFQVIKDGALLALALCLVLSVSFIGGLLDQLHEYRARIAQSCPVPDEGFTIGSRQRDALWPGPVECTHVGGRHNHVPRLLNKRATQG